VGAGPLVLLLHGFPQFWWTWRQQLLDLAEAGFRAVAVDLRGYGASDKPPRGYDLISLADDIAGLVAALGEQDAVIAGTDFGGLLAWSVATFDPHVVRRLVVLAAPHPLRLRREIALNPRQSGAVSPLWSAFQLPRWPERQLTREVYVARLFARWSGARWRASPGYPGVVERYVEAMQISQVAHSALEGFRWAVRSVPRTDGRRATRALRAGVRVPVLQLHGEDDPCMLLSTAQGSGRYVRGHYEWRALPGVGHFPTEEAPELISAELISWARR
jgi:pimeloyl-ACP methyl ester carboxylesterase